MSIAQKNDELRAQLPNLPKPHKLVLTPGIMAMGHTGVATAILKVKEFSNFNEENDPYGEHDVIIDGKIMCKIDYYDNDFEGFEEDGNRVFTIMRTSEY